MYQRRRKLLSQNFLHSRKLVKTLVDKSSIGKGDTVLEIGAGNGIITHELIKCAGQVIAIEVDPNLYAFLRKKFANEKNLTLIHRDFLKYPLPTFPYKVFANIPFAIEGKTIRKLIDANNPPNDCYLVVRRELALRLSGTIRENQFSLIHKPWFKFSIDHTFRKTDFSPIPKINAVMWRFNKLETPLLSHQKQSLYKNFIKMSFGYGLPIMRNLRCVIDPISLQEVFTKMNLRKKVKPSHLSFQEWLELFAVLEKKL